MRSETKVELEITHTGRQDKFHLSSTKAGYRVGGMDVYRAT